VCVAYKTGATKCANFSQFYTYDELYYEDFTSATREFRYPCWTFTVKLYNFWCSYCVVTGCTQDRKEAQQQQFYDLYPHDASIIIIIISSLWFYRPFNAFMTRLLIFDTVCMRSRVYVMVRLSVCLSHQSTTAMACGWFAAVGAPHADVHRQQWTVGSCSLCMSNACVFFCSVSLLLLLLLSLASF